MIEFFAVHEHVEVFKDRQFWFSADTMQEAMAEVRSESKGEM